MSLPVESIERIVWIRVAIESASCRVVLRLSGIGCLYVEVRLTEAAVCWWMVLRPSAYKMMQQVRSNCHKPRNIQSVSGQADTNIEAKQNKEILVRINTRQKY